MKEFVNDIQNLIVKHWGKLIAVFLIAGLIYNFDDAVKGFNDGYNSVRNK
ncbi:MAG: hypothetical protein RIR55_1889 [Bacteroidota bacterium]|jgi:hypothetical protein